MDSGKCGSGTRVRSNRQSDSDPAAVFIIARTAPDKASEASSDNTLKTPTVSLNRSVCRSDRGGHLSMAIASSKLQ